MKPDGGEQAEEEAGIAEGGVVEAWWVRMGVKGGIKVDKEGRMSRGGEGANAIEAGAAQSPGTVSAPAISLRAHHRNPSRPASQCPLFHPARRPVPAPRRQSILAIPLSMHGYPPPATPTP